MNDKPIRPQLRVPLNATEDEFQAVLLRWALLQGWHRHHVRPARTAKGWRSPVAGEPGFPDLVLARAGSKIAAELKTESTSPTNDQRLWLSELSGLVPPDDWASRGEIPTGRLTTNQDGQIDGVFLWRPRHWPYIEQLLRKAVRR